MALTQAGSKSGKGPKNIMNDLDYTTWMKFQKSFERYEFSENDIPKDFQKYVAEYIYFFTKGDNNLPVNVLTNIENIGEFNGRSLITILGNPISITWKKKLEQCPVKTFDYIILILEKIDNLKEDDAEQLFKIISKQLKTKTYATIYCIESNNTKPHIWLFANSCRNYLQLCDEKLFLDRENKKRPVYALQFRKINEIIPKKCFDRPIYTEKFDSPIYIIPKSPPRKKDEYTHPAKFPEKLIKELIMNFTFEKDWVLDIMVGTGSTLIAAYETKRNGIGIELLTEFLQIAKKRVEKVNPPTKLPGFESSNKSILINGDARNVVNLLTDYKEMIKYCITSPPYWNMLKNPGSEGQQKRRKQGLKLTYSEDNSQDISNISDYSVFLHTLVDIYKKTSSILSKDGKLTVIVKNVKQDGYLYTLAWDLVDELAGQNGKFNFIGYTLWCQDDIGVKPFAVGHHWVSNTLHQYCLHFQKK
jgi:DNA modification methylase